MRKPRLYVGISALVSPVGRGLLGWLSGCCTIRGSKGRLSCDDEMMRALATWLAVGLGTAAPGAAQPRVPEGGPTLEFDFPGLRIGVAEYDEGPTGGTVFAFDAPVLAAVDVRGGAPDTRTSCAVARAVVSCMVTRAAHGAPR
jgi:hypothetical protein